MEFPREWRGSERATIPAIRDGGKSAAERTSRSFTPSALGRERGLLAQVRLPAQPQNFRPRRIAEPDRRAPVASRRLERRAEGHAHAAAAEQPLAVAQDGARAADRHRHDRYPGLRRDHERPHAKRQQPRHAAVGPFDEHDERATAARQVREAGGVLRAALGIEALDIRASDAVEIDAREPVSEQLALGDEAVGFAQRGHQQQAVEVALVVDDHDAGVPRRHMLQAAHREGYPAQREEQARQVVAQRPAPRGARNERTRDPARDANRDE
jgi:hypothetical protein